MVSENKPNSTVNHNNKKKRKQYLPYNKPPKKGAYPLRPGLQGFFITCDGGKEKQAAHEAINVIDSFYDELVSGKAPRMQLGILPNKPLNKKVKFTYSDSSSSDDDDDKDDEVRSKKITNREEETTQENSTIKETSSLGEHRVSSKNQMEKISDDNDKDSKGHLTEEAEDWEPAIKKQCLESNTTASGKSTPDKAEKSVDKLIEAELAELGDRTNRRFSKLDSGCNGVVFVQMRKRNGEPCPKDIVQHMLTYVASTKKHVSRFILRVLPVEVTCYASLEEIGKAIKPLITHYFPSESETPQKFAVLYDARANTGIDRMKIIDVVAKSVPPPHKVDLTHPDINIVVQIVKTLCLIGVVEKYKELAKYNLRQLTSPN